MAIADTLDNLNKALDTERPKLNFFGRENEELEQQAILYVIDRADKPAIAQLLPFLKPDLFDHWAGHALMQLIHQYRDAIGMVPTRAQILKDFTDILSTDDFELYETIRQWLEVKADPKCYEYLTTKLVDDLRYRAYYKASASDKLHELIKAKEYDEVDRYFSQCFPPADGNNDTLDFKKDIDQIIAKDHIQSIPIGFHSLDTHMHETGPARGEVLVFLANTGVGKTTLLLNCARNCERNGLKVLYVALEGTSKAVAKRLASIYAEAPTRDLHDHADLARRAATSGTGDIKLVQPQSEVWTARHIAKKVEFLRITEGWIPDVICIDYAKLLRPQTASKSDQEYVKIARIMDEVKRIALDTDSLVLTAQQANREGEGQGMVGLKHAAGSYDALQPVDYCVSINQTPMEEHRNEMRLVINKNRHGRESVVAMCDINRASGRIKERV